MSAINLCNPLALGLLGEPILEPGEPPHESLDKPETRNILAFTSEHLLVEVHTSAASSDLGPDAGTGRCIQFKVKAISNLPHCLETVLILAYVLLNYTSECATLPGWQLGSCHVPLCQRAGLSAGQMKPFSSGRSC